MENGRDWEADSTTTPAYLIYDIEGYAYVKTTRGSVGGSEIRPILRRNNSGVWQYTTSTGTSVSWTSLPEDQDVYVVYKKAPDPVKGGTPKVKESGTEDPVDPVIHKESISNGDGTNTIGLSITADTSPLEVEKLADVIVIFDTSTSMRRKMGTSTTTYYNNDTPASEQAGEQTRLYLASQAVDKLADLLIGENTVFKDSAGNKLIRMSLISFDRDAVEQIGFTDNVNNYKAKVDALTTNQGTNWEAALDKANYMAVDPDRATFVIFVTDGNPSYRLDRGNTLTLEGYPGTVDDAHVDVYSSNTYYVYRAFQYFGALSESDARNYNTAAVDAKSIVDNNKILFSIGIGNTAGVSRLTGLTSAAYNSEEIGKERTKTAENEEELTQAFSDIAASIVALLGWGDIQMTDGITSLANTVEKSGLVQVDGKFEYWKAPAPEGWDEMTKEQRREFLESYQPDKDDFVKWDPSKEGCQEAVYDSASGSVKWDMGHIFVPESGCTYKVTFRVWPSQEAYDILANLKNGTVTYDSLPAAQKAQIVDHGNGSYSLKTNDKAPNTTYKAARKTNDGVTTSGDTQTLMFNDVDPMALVPEKMTVRKDWDHDMNMSHAADALKFRLLVDGKYYQKDGSFNSDPTNALILDISEEERETADGTKIPAWSNSVNIAPGIVIFDGTGDSKRTEVYETGHKYQLEEFDLTLEGEPVDAFDGSYEFTTQTVRPMVLTDEENGYHAELIYLILADDDNPVPAGAKTYTIDGETYYIAKENSSTVVGTNHRKAELDITKLINNNSGDPSITTDYLANETFTYRVTINVPEDADLSQMTAYEFVKRTDGDLFYIDGYKEGENPLPGDETRFSEKTYRWYTVRYPNTNKLEDSFTTEGAGEGRKQLVIDVTLKRDEVLRFTNIPTDTRYTITEVYANYRQANPSKDDDAPGSDKPSNLAEQGYSVTQILSSADEFEVDGNTITGTITEPNKRYYNQFTNTLGNVVEVKLDGVKHLEGYSWSGERYYFNLSGEGNPMPGINGRTRFYLTSESGTADKSYTFGKIRFTEPGTYTYTIAEDDAGTKKMVNGRLITFGAAETVKITIAKNAAGRLYVENVEGAHTSWNADTSTATTTITNSYDVEPTTASFPVVKELVVPEGLEGPAQWSYAIRVAAVDGAPVAETMTGTINQDTADATISFGPITYDAPGTYTYTVSESGTVTGVTNDPDAAGKTVTVSVVDNGDGTLTATPSSTPASPLKFTNTYNVGTVDATFPVKKELKVPEGLTGPTQWEYTITVAADDEAFPTAATMTGTVNQSKDTVSFGPFTYNAPGTYTYTVTESGTVAGVTNDSAAETGKTVTVTVTDNGAGALTASVSSTAAAPLTFTNTYDVEPTTASFPVEKILSVPQGMTGPAKWSYTIDVAAQGTAPAAETMSGTVDQDNTTATFGPFTYNKAGTYTYKVTETGTVAGVTNDAAATTGKTVTVTVVDNGNGTLTATADSTTDAPLKFTNTYDVGPTTVSFPVEKILSVPEGLDGPERWEYTINVAANGSAPVAATMTGKVNQDKESITFGPFEYAAPGEYTYTVSETGTVAGVTNDAQAAGKTVTVTVVDNGDGTMTATADSTTDEPLQFTNTYNVGEIEASFPVKKELVVPAGLEGPAQWSYTIDVAVVDGAPAAATMSGTVNQTTDTVTFGPFKYTAPGTYKYKVTETGTIAGVTNDAEAATGKEVTVTVTDSGDGTLTATASSTAAAPLTFTNNYDAEPTTAQIPVKKNITPANSGANDITGKFTFTLAAGSNTAVGEVETPMPESNTVLCGTDGAEVKFGEIEFSVPGTYTYTVKESVTGDDTVTSIDGITLETKDPKTLTVVVTDKGDGTLEAVVNGNVVTEFNNPYTVTSIDITIPVEKILSVPEGLTAPDITNAFTFTLADDSSDDVKSPLPKTTSITNPSATGGNMNFGTKDDPITISVPGEYLYTITETGTVDGVTNDATGTKTVKVTVTDNGDGTLSYTLDSEKVSFTNTYNVVPVTAQIPVEKILEVGEDLTAPDITEAFTFTLTAVDGAPMPEVTEHTNPDADGGDMTFGDITYTKPGTYTYTVTETGSVDGVSPVGTTEKTVTVAVVDNSDGTMTATVNGGKKLTFTNEYKVGEATAEIPVVKMLEYDEGLTPGDITNKFTFTLTAADGIPMPEVTSYTNPDPTGGTVKFGKITFTKPGDYTYTVTETGSADGVTNDSEASKTVVISVVDNSDGTMTATVNNGKDLVFTNTYDVEPTTASFPVKKILDKPDDTTGPASWSYRIDVAANDGAPVAETMTGTVSNTADTATFGPFTYTAPGTYTYTVSETGTIKGVTNDPAAAGKTVTVSVVDNGDGTMTATADSKVDAPLTFTNTYS
ncbi:MAG: VWA domain-containing protein, partial [Oscillospiraceae bacterium]|nr:VWA domain-containing protein [Oscillospiraceae bacterium]